MKLRGNIFYVGVYRVFKVIIRVLFDISFFSPSLVDKRIALNYTPKDKAICCSLILNYFHLLAYIII